MKRVLRMGLFGSLLKFAGDVSGVNDVMKDVRRQQVLERMYKMLECRDISGPSDAMDFIDEKIAHKYFSPDVFLTVLSFRVNGCSDEFRRYDSFLSSSSEVSERDRKNYEKFRREVLSLF